MSRSRLGLFDSGRTFDVLRSLCATPAVASSASVTSSPEWGRALGTLNNPRVDDAAVEAALSGLAHVVWRAGLWRHLRCHAVLYPAYDPFETYSTNIHSAFGPNLRTAIPRESRRWALLGRTVGLPIGVPASVLTANSEWVGYWASSGYNVITYKSVRSEAWEAHAPPNWHLEVAPPNLHWPSDDLSSFEVDVEAAVPWMVDGGHAVSLNSYGIPSPHPRVWEPDVARAIELLGEDQLLIVSVVGHQELLDDSAELASDFALAARHAISAGAEVVELNLSSPNSVVEGRAKRAIYRSVELSRRIVETVRDEIGDKSKLVIKLGYMDQIGLENLLDPIGDAIDGIAGINSLPAKVLKRGGGDFFPGRDRAGISGAPIRGAALDFAQSFAAVRLDLGLDADLVSVGGVTEPEDVLELFNLGAAAVQSATSAALDPSLALRCYEQIHDRLPAFPGTSTFNSRQSLRRQILKSLTDQSKSIAELALALDVPTPLTLAEVGDLLRIGEVVEDRSGLLKHAS